jgi:hypothetical protein
MIRLAQYGCLDWSEVKAAWKLGARGIPSGTAIVHRSVYGVGDGFVICRKVEPKEERLPYYASNTDCGYLNI